jgi:hypothetical protein
MTKTPTKITTLEEYLDFNDGTELTLTTEQVLSA